jgi:hypothetical protein
MLNEGWRFALLEWLDSPLQLYQLIWDSYFLCMFRAGMPHRAMNVGVRYAYVEDHSRQRTYHSASSLPLLGPPSQIAWQQTMIIL